PAPAASSTGEQQPLVPATVTHDGRVLTVHRAWADDGRGLPLELEDSAPTRSGARLRAARLDPATGQVTVLADGTDPRLPALARVLEEVPGGTGDSHRPGKRAVVRLEIGGAREGSEGERAGTRYVKIVRPGRAARLLNAISRSTAFEGPFRTARVL